MKPIDILKNLDKENKKIKYPNVPDHCICAYDYKDKKANGLTRCIIDWIKFNGGQAERINTMGRPIDRTKVVTDVCGFKKQIGSIEWVQGTATRGSADISATIKRNGIGISVKIEVKIGADRQSEHQKKYESDVTSAGGVYYIAKDFNSFYEWYNNMFK